MSPHRRHIRSFFVLLAALAAAAVPARGAAQPPCTASPKTDTMVICALGGVNARFSAGAAASTSAASAITLNSGAVYLGPSGDSGPFLIDVVGGTKPVVTTYVS
ncbi:MAG TPA: hypothetical protein VNP72_04080, partial [Longimicrobium sp.]|nr:hypothetical protein [Longimicrobium sp.]